MYDDNVMYMEIRTTLPNLYNLDGKVYDAAYTVKTFKDVVDR